MSNFGLEEALKKQGIAFYRVPVGDRYVMEALEQKGWNLGGEPSGHLLCLDINRAVDGIISALAVLGISRLKQQTVAELKQGMKKYPQVLINIPTANPSYIMNHTILKSALIKIEEALQAEGGRVLLRPSGTEPVIRLMIEGKNQQRIQDLAAAFAATIQAIQKK